jgi:hypothetical protein
MQLKIVTQHVSTITGLPVCQIPVNSEFLITVSKYIISLSARPRIVTRFQMLCISRDTSRVSVTQCGGRRAQKIFKAEHFVASTSLRSETSTEMCTWDDTEENRSNRNDNLDVLLVYLYGEVSPLKS